MRKIAKSLLGELSKIQEELDEAKDAKHQNCKIMIRVELSDLLGALKHYAEKKLGINLFGLIAMSNGITDNYHQLNIARGVFG